jgi:hypothetical protein
MISHNINNIAFRLKLPGYMNLHQVFHVPLLEPCAFTSIPNRVFPPPPLVYFVERLEYEVQAILDSKSCATSYIILWIGLEYVANIALELLEEFYCLYPNNPHPCSHVMTRGTRCQKKEIVS